jgi:hypothetical protein
VHQPLVRGSGQRHAGEGQEPPTLHPAITTAQHSCRFDGTPVVPGSAEHRVVLGISEGVAGCVGVARLVGHRLPLGEHGVQLLDRDGQGLGELGPRPRLGRRFAPLPTPDGRRFDAHELSKRFLGVAHNLTAIRQSAALGFHGFLSSNGLVPPVRERHIISTGHAGRRISEGMTSGCGVDVLLSPAPAGLAISQGPRAGPNAELACPPSGTLPLPAQRSPVLGAVQPVRHAHEWGYRRGELDSGTWKRSSEGSVVIREDRELLARLIAAGKRLLWRADELNHVVIEGEMLTGESITLPSHIVEPDWQS